MSDIAKIGNVFEKIALKSNDFLELTKTVGEIGARTIDLVVAETTGSKVVRVVDHPVTLGAEANVKLFAELASADDAAGTLDAFGDAYSQNAPAGTRPAVFTLQGRLGVEAGMSAQLGSAGQVSAALVAGADCEYRQVTPVFANDSLATALTKCAGTSRLPGPHFGLDLAPGQSRRFQGHLSLGLDVKASAGKSLTMKKAVNLFQGAPHLRVAAEAAVSAALGFALDESMTFTVGKGSQATSAVRLRLERASSRRITFGAAVAVRAETNAGSILAALLDHLFDLDPVAETLEVFEKVAALKDEAGWKKLRETLADSGAERFVELVEDEGWIDWDGARIGAFVEQAKRVVAAWKQVEELDDRLRAWIDAQLAAVGLAPGSTARTALGRLAALDPDPEALGTRLADEIRAGGGAELLTLLELVTGRSLEQLVSLPLTEVAPLVRRAVDAAKQAEALLAGLGDHQLSLVGDYVKKSGIVDVVEWLEANASSVLALKGAMSKAVRKVVSRLVDGAWEKLDEADLHRIREFAGRVAKELDNLKEWHDAVTDDLKRIDQGLGFRLGIEVSRVTTEEALLDLEIAESDPAFGQVAEAFGWGKIAKVLSLVADAFEKNGEESPRDIVVRECALVSRFVRTSALTSLLQAFGIDGLSTRKAQRFYQRAVTVPGGGVERHVRHTAGARVSETGKDGVFAAGIELGFGARGPLDLEKSYAQILDGELRLTVQVEDSRLELEELEALDTILAETGYTGPVSVAEARQPGQTALKFALELSFKGPVSRITEVLEKASSSEKGWTDVVMRAGGRWLSDQLITAGENAMEGVRTGAVMEALLLDAAVATEVAKGANEAFSSMKAKKRIKVGSKWVSLLSPDGKQVEPSLTPLVYHLPSVRGDSLRCARKFADLPIQVGKHPSEVLSAVKAFALFAISMTPNDSIRNPMLGFWILWNVLSKQDLEQRGIATCRFSGAKKGSPWTPPFLWTA